MVRIAGSWVGIAQTFKAVADHYGWTHIVLLSDDETTRICWQGAKPFDDIFGKNVNYTFTWLRFGSHPTDEQLDDILQQIRSRTRGLLTCIMLFRFIARHYTRLRSANWQTFCARSKFSYVCMDTNAVCYVSSVHSTLLHFALQFFHIIREFLIYSTVYTCYKLEAEQVGYTAKYIIASLDVYGVTQWSCSVTRGPLLLRSFCSAPRITTWLTATSLSSRSGLHAVLALTGRGLPTSRFQEIFLDVFEHFTPLNRCVFITTGHWHCYRVTNYTFYYIYWQLHWVTGCIRVYDR